MARRKRALGKIDELDIEILSELIRDSGVSVPRLSKKLGQNPSVIYSRIKRMTKRGLVRKFTVEVHEELLGYTVTALVGVKIDAKQRDAVLTALSKIPELRGISEVTGRFDLFLTIRVTSLDELHNLVAERIGTVTGVVSTETFLQLRAYPREPAYSVPE